MSGIHHAHLYYTLQEYLASHSVGTPTSDRYWTIRWNRHVEKRGNVPVVSKCAECSGKVRKLDLKLGRFKAARPSKVLRDESKGAE